MKLPFLTLNGKQIRTFVKFCFVGLSGVAVNMGVFWFLTRIAGFTGPLKPVAIFLGIELSILSNFILNDVWTFKDRRERGKKAVLLRAMKFNSVSVGYFVIFYAVFGLFYYGFGVYDMLSQLIAIGIGTIWNFSLSILWTWRRKEEPSTLNP